MIACETSGAFCFTHRFLGFKAHKITRIKSEIAHFLDNDTEHMIKIKIYGKNYLCNKSYPNLDIINKSSDV